MRASGGYTAAGEPDELYYNTASKSMGKRELLLIVAFAVVGAIVYQVTAPAPPAGSRSVSVGGLIEKMRRAARGNRSSAELKTTQQHPIDASVTDLRLRLRGTTIFVEGEDRADVAVELSSWSNGYDDAEAQRLVKQVVLKVDAAGSVLIATIQFPDPGQQRATARFRIPARMRVRIDENGPAVTVAGVAALEFAALRGDASVSRIAGGLSGLHRFGELTVNEVGSLKLTTQGSEARIAGVKDVSLTVRGGDVRVAGATGTIEIETSQGDVTLEKLEAVTTPIRVNANGGTVTINGLGTEARVDGRNTAVKVTMDRAAPLAIYNEGEDDVEFTPPPGGYKLDVLVRDGRLAPADVLTQLGISPVTDEDGRETRASGAVAGGGPTITLRAVRGDIVIRPRTAVEK